MKKDIHPELYEVTVHCACGESFKTRSTSPEIKVTLCSQCHPFFTGSQKFVDTAGRIEKFQKRYKKETKEKAPKIENVPKSAKTPKEPKVKKAVKVSKIEKSTKATKKK